LMGSDDGTPSESMATLYDEQYCPISHSGFAGRTVKT
jgi:hypothetical protein